MHASDTELKRLVDALAPLVREEQGLAQAAFDLSTLIEEQQKVFLTVLFPSLTALRAHERDIEALRTEREALQSSLTRASEAARRLAGHVVDLLGTPLRWVLVGEWAVRWVGWNESQTEVELVPAERLEDWQYRGNGYGSLQRAQDIAYLDVGGIQPGIHTRLLESVP
ncbi:MAG: hypothetical protein ACYC5M_12705 [Anaerolineae bacterium]